jgi:hypothetical protein
MYITTQQSLSEFIQENLVNGKLSFSAAAELLGIHPFCLIRDGAFKSQKLTQKLTEQGFTSRALQKDGFCSKSFWLTLEYFAYDSKPRTECAKQLVRTFGSFGVTTAFAKLEAK